MPSTTQLHPIWRDYPALQPELQDVMQLMTTNINIPDKAINDAILAMIHGAVSYTHLTLPTIRLV